MGSVIEPIVQGQRTGLSPLAVILVGGLLDAAVGPHRPAARHTADRRAGRPRPPRRAAGVPQRDARRYAAALPARALLSAHAGRAIRPRRSSRPRSSSRSVRSSITTTRSSSRDCGWRRPTPTAARWSRRVSTTSVTRAKSSSTRWPIWTLSPRRRRSARSSISNSATARRRTRRPRPTRSEDEEDDREISEPTADRPRRRLEAAERRAVRRQPHRAR